MEAQQSLNDVISKIEESIFSKINEIDELYAKIDILEEEIKAERKNLEIVFIQTMDNESFSL